jgi:hypothetical protein
MNFIAFFLAETIGFGPVMHQSIEGQRNRHRARRAEPPLPRDMLAAGRAIK